MAIVEEYRPSWLEVRRWRCDDWKRRKTEKLRLWFVWKLPRWVIYWAAIRIIANATTGEFGNVAPDAVPAMTLLKHWERRRGGDPSNT